MTSTPRGPSTAAHAPRVLELRTDDVVEMEGNREIRLDQTTDLLASMQEEGQLSPGMVRRLPEAPDKFLCLAGHRRLFCCRILGRPFLALEVEGEADQGRLLKLAITDNNCRKALTLLELGESIARYSQATGCVGNAELAEALNLTPSEVSRALSLPKKLAADLHAFVRDRAVPRTHVELIASVPDHDQQRALLAWVAQEKPRREDLERRVAELRGKKGPSSKPLTLKLGRCTLQVADPTHERLQHFLDALSSALKKAGKDALPLAVLPSLLK